MSGLKTQRLQYASDNYGNPLYAKVCWQQDTAAPKPIVLIFHGGGLVIGSAEMIPQVQVSYLASHNFLVVIPNYRLCPQVNAVDGAIADTHRAYDWSCSQLVSKMQDYGIEVDASRVAAVGMSAGGLLALHLGSRGHNDIRAVNAVYPSLYLAGPESGRSTPYALPPYGLMPDFNPTDAEWEEICPSNLQVSETGGFVPGQLPPPRSRYMLDCLKHGTWMKALGAGDRLEAVDACTKFASTGDAWPPTIFVQGENDDVPGSGLKLVERAVRDLKAVGAKTVEVEAVADQHHMFDVPPEVGTSDLGPRWQAVKKGLDFLIAHTLCSCSS